MEWELQPGRDERLAGNLDTSLLKTLALLFMLIDHLGVALFGNLLELRMIGRMALPLYAWCLVVGNVKTRHPLRYFGRLLLLAAISQPLYMMALNHTWQHLNILFLLALAAFLIPPFKRLRRESRLIGKIPFEAALAASSGARPCAIWRWASARSTTAGGG